MSVSRQTTSRAGAPAELEHRLGERSRASSSVFMNAPSPTLTSSTIASAPPASFFDMMLDGDQRDDVDGRGDVAERVELLVGRDEVGGLADDREPDLAHLRDELLGRQLDAEAGDRLELVERAAGVAEPAAAHLPERDAAGGDDRADRDRRLVADAAGRVLVDDLAAERGAEVDRLAARDHRVGQRVRLRAGEAAEVDGHAATRPSGSRAPRRARSRGRARSDLVGRELLAVALALDQLGRRGSSARATKIDGRAATSEAGRRAPAASASSIARRASRRSRAPSRRPGT